MTGKIGEKKYIMVVQKAPRMDENINESLRKKCVLICVVLLFFSWKNKN